jgi:polyphosphate kinase 2 (PPK2 family)
VPPKGYIGIFNRSHYEDVLVTRVHGLINKKTAEKRFCEIRDFEQMLHQNGTVILKFFLHISKAEQKKRLEARAQDPKKHWKFSINDIHERRFWPKYQQAFQEALENTSTGNAPWYVVPANNKWYRNLVVGKIVVETLKGMNLKYPPPPKGINFKKLRIPD